MLFSLLTTLAIIIIGFALGKGLSYYFPQYINQLSLYATKVALQVTIPLSLLSAIWQLKHLQPQLFLITVVGSVVIFIGGPLAACVTAPMKLTRQQRGALIPGGFFMNIGAIGTLCVFLFLGDDGLALVPLYKLFEEVIYYTIAFPIARRFGESHMAKPRALWKDPFLLSTLGAVSCGFILNITNIPRPIWMADLNTYLVPAGTLLLMISAGLVFRITDAKGLFKKTFTLVLARTLLSPLLALGLSYGLGLQAIAGGLPVKVSFILAWMPTAFLCLLPPVLYGVDQKIANTYWLVSSLWFFLMLPVAMFFLGWL